MVKVEKVFSVLWAGSERFVGPIRLLEFFRSKSRLPSLSMASWMSVSTSASLSVLHGFVYRCLWFVSAVFCLLQLIETETFPLTNSTAAHSWCWGVGPQCLRPFWLVSDVIFTIDQSSSFKSRFQNLNQKIAVEICLWLGLWMIIS